MYYHVARDLSFDQICGSSRKVMFSPVRSRQRDEEEYIKVAKVVYGGTGDMT